MSLMWRVFFLPSLLELEPMPKLGSITPRRFIAALKRHGFELDHVTGSHYVFRHPITKSRAMVAYHNRSLPKGTAQKILKSSGLSLDDL